MFQEHVSGCESLLPIQTQYWRVVFPNQDSGGSVANYSVDSSDLEYLSQLEI